MPKYEGLNETQQRLYDELQTSIKEGENIIDLLTKVLKEDLLKILTTVKRIEFEDGEEHTLTPLAYAINLKKRLNSQRYIKNILVVAERNNILEVVLTTANIKIKLSNGQEYILTPLAHAIILNNQRGIDTILDIAKKDKELLEKVLTAASIKIRLSDDQEHILTPLNYSIDLINQEVSQKSIKAILDVAQDSDMLEKVVASVRKDCLNQTRKILEILKNQEQDQVQKDKIDGWLEVLAKSISSCESKDDFNKIKWQGKVNEILNNQEQEDYQITLERIVPNHKNKDTSDVLKEILNSSSQDPQQIADRITVLKKIMSSCESSEQSFKIENIDQKDTVKTTNKPIIIGNVCGVIAALAVGGGLFAAGVALPILAIIGIAIAAAVIIGLVAGGITYAISKPSENLDRANVEQGVGIGVNITA